MAGYVCHRQEADNTDNQRSDKPPCPRARGSPGRRPADPLPAWGAQGGLALEQKSPVASGGSAKPVCAPARARPGCSRRQGIGKARSRRGAAEPRSQAQASSCCGGAGCTALTEHGSRAETRAPGRVEALGSPAHRPPQDQGRTKGQRASPCPPPGGLHHGATAAQGWEGGGAQGRRGTCAAVAGGGGQRSKGMPKRRAGGEWGTRG